MLRFCNRVFLIFSLLAGAPACAQPTPQLPAAPPQTQQQPLPPPFGIEPAKPSSTAREFPITRAVSAKHGMVVTPEPHAAHIGVEILKKGGNAVDAAVAVGFALAVTYPAAGNIGGGGFMLIHLAAGKKDIAIDYRELSPA